MKLTAAHTSALEMPSAMTMGIIASARRRGWP